MSNLSRLQGARADGTIGKLDDQSANICRQNDDQSGVQPARYLHYCLIHSAIYIMCVLQISSVYSSYFFVMKNANDTTILGSWRRVAFLEEFFDSILKSHCTD